MELSIGCVKEIEEIKTRKAESFGPKVAVSPAQPPAPRVKSPKAEPKQVSSGTGFFITSDGSILTNAHVVKDCTEIKVVTKAGTFVKATVSAMDAINDLALLRADTHPHEVAALLLTPRLGDPVEAFGYPSRTYFPHPAISLLGIFPRFRVLAMTVAIFRFPCPCNRGTLEVVA